MKLYDEPEIDQYGHMRFAEDDDHYYECWPMGFNDRLIVMEKDNPFTYEYGWCFEKRGGLVVAAVLAMWDPETEDEPVGWHKRAGHTRCAPKRDENPGYNRPRCVHGSYMDEPCKRDRFCKREGKQWRTR